MATQLALCLDRLDAPSTVCSYCGDDWIYDGHGIYGVDIYRADGDVYVRWLACCTDVHEFVELYGFEDVYGRTLASVVSEIIGEPCKVLGDGDGAVVCKLRVVDPVEVGPRDDAGHAKAISPKGWRGHVFARVEQHHRHHKAPIGHKFSIACYNGSAEVAVAIVSRPVSRRLQQAEPHTLEVTRVCAWGHSALRRNAISKLYGAAAKRARKLGYRKLITYTLGSESGTSLRASGFTPVATTRGGSWDRPGRARTDKAPTCAKVRWERVL